MTKKLKLSPTHFTKMYIGCGLIYVAQVIIVCIEVGVILTAVASYDPNNN